MTTDKSANNCSTKHMRLMAIIVTIVLVVCGGLFTYTSSAMAAYEQRLRVVEQQNVRITTILERLEQTLGRIERKGIQP